MFKFLRKYNKWILAVGGTLLMIVFLIPQAISSLSQRAAVGSAVWATVGDDAEEVPGEARRQTERELQVLEKLRSIGMPLIADDPEHWYLLVREAQRAGVVGPRASDQLPAEQMDVLFTVAGRNPLVDETIGKQLGVARLLGLYRNAGKLSDARVRDEARRLFHAVDGRAIVLRAEARDDAPEPDEAAIARQFEAYRDLAPDSNPDDPEKPGFGYRLPDRLEIEYLTVARAGVRATIEAGDALNGIALSKHWQRYHKDRGFPAPAPGVAVPPEVREDLLNDLTDEKLTTIERFATDQLLASWRDLRAPEGYYELPDDWAARRVSFEKLAAGIQTEFGIPLPAYRAIGDRWLTVDEAAELPELSDAATDKFGAPAGIAQLLPAIREFGGDNVMFLQGGIAGPVLRGQGDGNLVLFRVTDTEAAHPPATVDEVRAQVVADLKRQADYERLLALADSIAATARADGLLAAAVANDAPLRPLNRLTLYNTGFAEFQLQRNAALQPFPSELPDGLGAHVPAITQVIDQALALPAVADLADLPPSDRIFPVPIDSEMAIMIVELTAQHPLDRALFERLTEGGRFQDMLVTRELAELGVPTRDVFDLDTLRARQHFKVLRREAETAPDDEESPSEDAAADARAVPPNS